jgi:hypothetical protein
MEAHFNHITEAHIWQISNANRLFQLLRDVSAEDNKKLPCGT